MEKKLEIKDLITVGIFTALYFAITFVVACFSGTMLMYQLQ